MKQKQIMVTLLVAICLNACTENTSTEKTATTKTETIAQPAKTVLGSYEGTTPGANSLIKETLSLNTDKTFTKKLVYIDKGNKEFTTNGTFTMEAENIVLNVDHDKENGFYKIVGENLLQLDITGKEITGSNAAMYTMKKVNN